MKFRILLSVLLIGIIGKPGKCNRTHRINILVFSKTAVFRHESIEAGKAMFLQMATAENFKVDTTEDASLFTKDNLKRYDVVVFLNTTGDVLNDSQQQAFQWYISSGKRFLGIHAAVDTEYDWPWYNELAGAYFANHPKPQTASFSNLQKDNPAMQGWPGTFSRFEELYNFQLVKVGKSDVILTVDEKSYTGGQMGEFHPMAWCREFGGGRMFYTALGHHPETYSDPDFRKHILGALKWLLSRD
jgi:type 1 glutamine amidotransferase